MLPCNRRGVGAQPRPGEIMYPTGTRVEIWWKGDEVWYAATIIKTRVTTKTANKAKEPCHEILCSYDLDGVIQWHSLHNTTVRETSSSPPAAEANDVDDPFPAGSRVEVWWKGDKAFYRATVLTTRTNCHKIQGIQTMCREVYCDYDLDGHMQWHSLHNNYVRTSRTEAQQTGTRHVASPARLTAEFQHQNARPVISHRWVRCTLSLCCVLPRLQHWMLLHRLNNVRSPYVTRLHPLQRHLMKHLLLCRPCLFHLQILPPYPSPSVYLAITRDLRTEPTPRMILLTNGYPLRYERLAKQRRISCSKRLSQTTYSVDKYTRR